MARTIRCPNCKKDIPASFFFRQMGALKSARKARASLRNLQKAMKIGHWGAPKGNQNWRGRLKKKKT